MLNKLFKLQENNTTIQKEAMAGVTTFMTMAYIIFVQPAILANCGMDFDSVMVATCIASAIGCFTMAFFGQLSDRVGARDGAQCLLRLRGVSDVGRDLGKRLDGPAVAGSFGCHLHFRCLVHRFGRE